MEVLLEIHTQEELEKYSSEISLVGINNRNLKTFEVDFENSIRLAQQLPNNTVKIAESGIKNKEDFQYINNIGYDGALIGTRFMKSGNPGNALADMLGRIPQ